MCGKKSVVGMITGIGLCLLLCGCGAETENQNVKNGMTAIAEMDYQGAMESFAMAEKQGEDARLIARGKGIASMGMTDYEAAVTYLKECLSYSDGVVQPMDFDVNYYLAAAHCKNGEFAEAEKIYTAILDLKEDADALFLRGNARLELSKQAEAVADFESVLTLLPSDYDRLIDIYEVLAAHGLKEKGQEYLQTALSEKGDKMSSYAKGRIYYYLGEYQQACVSLEDAKSAGTAEVYLYLGRAYEATGDYNYAIQNVYTYYLQGHEGNAELYNQLGLCYMYQKDYEAALSAFQSAMNIPENGMMQTLRFNEIVAYEHLGKYTDAAALLDNYLKTYPDDETAVREYGFLSTR